MTSTAREPSSLRRRVGAETRPHRLASTAFDGLLDIGMAIADDVGVDWAAAEQIATESGDLQLLAGYRAVARMADAARRLAARRRATGSRVIGSGGKNKREARDVPR